jgi:hypothetical protein
MLGKRATGQRLAMVSKRGRRPGGESVNDRTMAGVIVGVLPVKNIMLKTNTRWN